MEIIPYHHMFQINVKNLYVSVSNRDVRDQSRSRPRGPGPKEKLYRDQKKNFSRTRTGTEKKLPGPNKKSYRDLDRDPDQKKVVSHISSSEHCNL
jgi:hypothetical protein